MPEYRPVVSDSYFPRPQPQTTPVYYAPSRRETARMDREYGRFVEHAMDQAQREEVEAALDLRHFQNRMIERAQLKNFAYTLGQHDPALLAELLEVDRAHHEGVISRLPRRPSRWAT